LNWLRGTGFQPVICTKSTACTDVEGRPWKLGAAWRNSIALRGAKTEPQAGSLCHVANLIPLRVLRETQRMQRAVAGLVVQESEKIQQLFRA
jgi:hypothetical protein